MKQSLESPKTMGLLDQQLEEPRPSSGLSKASCPGLCVFPNREGKKGQLSQTES